MFLPVRQVFTLLLKHSSNLTHNPTSNFHLLSAPVLLNKMPEIVQQRQELLSPVGVNLNPSCGFKVKGFLKKRCKDCFFVRREERWYILCDTHPRHKQMQVMKKPKNTWMLSHATQGKVRPW